MKNRRPLSTYKLPLQTAEVDLLITLLEMQPATPKLIGVARKIGPFDTSQKLKRLVEAGLASRERYQQPKSDYGESRMGKPPYLYRLTDRGEQVAIHLHRAAETLHEQATHQRDIPGPTVSDQHERSSRTEPTRLAGSTHRGVPRQGRAVPDYTRRAD